MRYNRRMDTEFIKGSVALHEEAEVWTVSQITRRVKGLLEKDIGKVWVSGEISNWKVAGSGHAYFTLKDDKSQLAAVMFRGQLNKLKFEPESGLEVIVRGLVSVYEQRGAYQIICEEMQPKGVGALQLAFEKLRKKLDEEGLFDPEHKKPLPLLPRRIGVVTSPTGAAIRDILNVIGRRFAHVHVLLYPVRVQGDEAAAEIVEGIRELDDYGVDVMIVGRGGGSLEDLWAFNEESVVRAVFDAKTPIIAAVGHEIDFTLSDFAADVRAPTPSAAAELVVQEHEALLKEVADLRKRLGKSVAHTFDGLRNRLELLQSSYIFRRPDELIRQRRQRCDELRMGMDAALRGQMDRSRHRLDKAQRGLRLLSPANQIKQAVEKLRRHRQRLLQAGKGGMERYRARYQPLVGRLNALSPLAILSRGYAIARKLPEETLVREAAQLKKHDRLRVTFGQGEAEATVDEVRETGDNRPSAKE